MNEWNLWNLSFHSSNQTSRLKLVSILVLSPLYNFSFAIPILTVGRSATLGSWVPWDFDSKHSSGAILSFIHISYNTVGTVVGLPRWSPGKESAHQFGRCRRDGQSLGQEDSLEEEMATHSSILAWRIPWTEEPGGLQSMGLQSVRHDWVIYTHTHFILWLHWALVVMCSLSTFGPRVQLPQGRWEPITSSSNRDWICIPGIGRQTVNHWTIREIPVVYMVSCI